jgi:hypothetical protein
VEGFFYVLWKIQIKKNLQFYWRYGVHHT